MSGVLYWKKINQGETERKIYLPKGNSWYNYNTNEIFEGGQEIKMNFDLASCTFCGLCKDFCPKKAITLTNEVLMVSENKEELKVGGSFIKKLPPKPAAKPKDAINTKEAVVSKEDEKKK